jgi:hypothetical protein
MALRDFVVVTYRWDMLVHHSPVDVQSVAWSRTGKVGELLCGLGFHEAAPIVLHTTFLRARCL